MALEDGGSALVAAVPGVVERVNKLVSVRPLRARYGGDIGDVVVGRITEVGLPKDKEMKGSGLQMRNDDVLAGGSKTMEGRCKWSARCYALFVFGQSSRGSSGWVLSPESGETFLNARMQLVPGMQRRKTEMDELNMRTFFEEGDLVCVRVCVDLGLERLPEQYLILVRMFRPRSNHSLGTVRPRFTRGTSAMAR